MLIPQVVNVNNAIYGRYQQYTRIKNVPCVRGSVRYFLKCLTTSRFATIPPFSTKNLSISSSDSSLAAMTEFEVDRALPTGGHEHLTEV